MKIQSPTTAPVPQPASPSTPPAASKALPVESKNTVAARPAASDGFDGQAPSKGLPPALSGETTRARPATPAPTTPTLPTEGKISPKDIPAANWTMFVNLNADNNLEPDGKNDLNEMEAGIGQLAGKMNVIALVDGGTGKDSINGWTNGTRLMYVTPDPTNSKKVTSREIDVDPASDLGKMLAAGKGELDTGSPQVLRAALDYVQRNVKSEHFAVDLWDHGNGWRGVSYDDHPSSSLDMQELKQALSGLPKKVDILSADACLMATAEVADTAKAAGADWLVGSEEVEPGSGWNYTDLLSRASKLFEGGVTDVSAEKMSNAILESYAAGPSSNVTMSATNLAKLPALNSSLDSFSDALVKAGGLQDKSLRSAYQSALRFDDKDQMDVGDFARRVAQGTQNPALKTAAEQLLATLNQTTTHSAAKGAAGKYGAATGMTLYAPQGSVDRAYQQKGSDWLQSKWNDVLSTYSGTPRVS